MKKAQYGISQCPLLPGNKEAKIEVGQQDLGTDLEAPAAGPAPLPGQTGRQITDRQIDKHPGTEMKTVISQELGPEITNLGTIGLVRIVSTGEEITINFVHPLHPVGAAVGVLPNGKTGDVIIKKVHLQDGNLHLLQEIALQAPISVNLVTWELLLATMLEQGAEKRKTGAEMMTRWSSCDQKITIDTEMLTA